MLFIISLLFLNIHSKIIHYQFYQTNDICKHNWEGSICLPIDSLNKLNQSLTIRLDINKKNPCSTNRIVYIRSKQCIYCAKNLQHIHCNDDQQHSRYRRMISTNKEDIHKNSLTIIGISLLTILIIGSIVTLLFIKRSQAHTNLLELFNPSNANVPSINHIKVPQTTKSAHTNPPEAIRLTVPKTIPRTQSDK